VSRFEHEMSATVTDYNTPPDGVDPDAVAVRAGRQGVPYTDVHDWVTFSSVTAEAKALYVIYRAHVNRARGDDLVWTSALVLAKIMGYSRGDKITRFNKELEDLGALQIDRNNVCGRMVFIVNQEPPAGYKGPLTVADWHARNKPELDRIRAEDKAKRDARRAAAKARKDAEAGTSEKDGGAVHPKQGEPAVHPERGEQVHAERGVPVHPERGREQDVLELEEENKKNQTPVADATGGESKPSSAQTTIDGTEESLEPKAATLNELAKQDARIWMDYWSSKGSPIAGDHVHAKLRALIEKFLKAEYTVVEVREAFRRIGAPVIPTPDRVQRELAAVRGVAVAPVSGAGRGAGAAVNDHWNRDKVPANVPAQTPKIPAPAAPRAQQIQTTGGAW
jgi:hypothetical protein